MTSVTPDISSRLKPDFIAVIDLIYKDVCNLQAGQNVLIISDARTPDHIVATFQGMAQAAGAEAVRIECAIPVGGATYQPGASWPAMLCVAAQEADLIIDMAVGYAKFIVEAINNGTRVICPGDGIAGPFLDDMLIRTMLHSDIHAVRRHADRIAQRFTDAKVCTVMTGDDEFTLDIDGVEGFPCDGFLWDKDKNDWKTSWGMLPPAQPGMLIPLGRGNGTVNVDGTLLYHPEYHEQPGSPLSLSYSNGRLIDIGGETVLASRLEKWLEDLNDDGAYNGPVHFNIGNSPNAMLTQGQEWERVYGSITCGMGDLNLLGILAKEAGMAMTLSKSTVHWDWTILQPRILLDGDVFAEKGRIYCD